ncbi:hypothetical protein A9F13_02g02134 [Clavispora lusitaniae]|uniref:Uncharacterized protein n=1 Tax=Clavispora lusitaniae TaxID=36911 RepID=A0AA91Q318_CLALS|nr:hypothetical protein A9F13_02g02134 [Clavispora lusitaniae]
MKVRASCCNLKRPACVSERDTPACLELRRRVGGAKKTFCYRTPVARHDHAPCVPPGAFALTSDFYVGEPL